MDGKLTPHATVHRHLSDGFPMCTRKGEDTAMCERVVVQFERARAGESPPVMLIDAIKIGQAARWAVTD